MRPFFFDIRSVAATVARAIALTSALTLPACGGSIDSAPTCGADPACNAGAAASDTTPTEPAPPGAPAEVGTPTPHAGGSPLAGFVGEWDVAYAMKGTCTNVADAAPTSSEGETRVTLTLPDPPEQLLARSELWYACPNMALSSTSSGELRGECTRDTLGYAITLRADDASAKLAMTIRQSLGEGNDGKPASCEYTVTGTARKR